MKEKILKFINVTKRDGFILTLKKSIKYINANYVNKINIKKRIIFNKEYDN